jgi:hypothetical protein
VLNAENAEKRVSGKLEKNKEINLESKKYELLFI